MGDIITAGTSWELNSQQYYYDTDTDIDIGDIVFSKEEIREEGLLKIDRLYFPPNDCNRLALMTNQDMDEPSNIENSPSSSCSMLERILQEAEMEEKIEVLQSQQEEESYTTSPVGLKDVQNLNSAFKQIQDIEISNVSQKSTYNKVLSTKKIDKRSIRREKNNKASRELRARRKEEQEKLSEKEELKQKQNEELRLKILKLQMEKENFLKLYQYIADVDSKKYKEKFLMDFKNLLCYFSKAETDRDETSEKLYKELIAIYHHAMKMNYTEREIVDIGDWLKSYFGVEVR